ncbi:hypothetical protein [Tsukamurella ocularis]|uniref:hypothetical protein n=1 Tax=Tsukamurella ocularis TaxID=1970234 RepID=UPI0021697934|nr:hypothetical protein [Tsukamurella ocularis]MCS3780883.1 hypothetical protein [Tsukamurella ocularis]MCS3786707.1 hypothetical protein [Tsukamurella ocularis]MCS3850549.1 hypothetical protein [Tsukamurella ocularis]
MGEGNVVDESRAIEDQGEEGDSAQPIRVTRFAICLLRLGNDAKPMFTVPEARELSESVSLKIIEALESDSRVAEVLSAPQERNIDNACTTTYLEPESTDENSVIGVRDFEALRLNSSIEFRVRVPVKNQPRYRSMDDVPADDYLVSWDGSALYVQWHQANSRKSGSGGHIVFDVVESVAKQAGFEATVIACSRGCQHRFFHGDLVTYGAESTDEGYKLLVGNLPIDSIATPYSYELDEVDLLRQIRADLSTLIESFARASSVAKAILYWGWRARCDASDTLAIAYDRSTRSPWYHFKESIPARWEDRGSGRRVKQLLSAQWLALASIDLQVPSWREWHRRFVQQVEQKKLAELGVLFDSHANEVEMLDMSTVRASVAEVATRAEAKSLRYATLLGAVSALGGATLGSAATVLFF